MQEGGLAATILNAANEIAVAAFLQQKIRFTDIATVVEHTLNQIQNSGAESIELILQADQNARTVAQHFVLNKGS